MDTWHHYNPVQIEASSIDSLPNWMQKLSTRSQLGNVKNGKWLLVTSEGMTKRGVTDRVKTLTSEFKASWFVHDNVSPNPELDDLDALTERLQSEKIIGVVALGGGSVIDAAKVLAVTLPSGARNPLKICFREGLGQNWNAKLPLIAIPTTSGTGAEVTPFATVWDKTSHKKHSVTGHLIIPDIALLDPTLTVSLPKSETLNTGLDAISHSCESLWNKNKTPVSESLARHALALLRVALPKVLSSPDDINARTTMQQGSVLAGIAISHTRTALAHSISYPLTIHYNVPHGLACSFTLPGLIDEFLLTIEDVELSKLLSQIKVLLDSLHLKAQLSRYASEEEILALMHEMNHPDRASNATFQVDIKKLLVS